MKALIIATFGSTYEGALRRDLDPVVDDLTRAAKGIAFRVAFTSRMVIRRYREQTGIQYLNEVQSVEAFLEEGVRAEEIFIQPLHIIEGAEYEKLLKLNDRGVKVGEALFHCEKDLVRFVEVVRRHFTVPTVFVGHGSYKTADKNYGALNRLFQKEGLPHCVCTSEGSIDDTASLAFVKEKGFKEVQLAPLLLLAGEHAKKDIFGEENSVKSRFEAEGIVVRPVAGGMGSWDFIRALYVEKLRNQMKENLCEN